jgi:hypothetical protein
LVPSFAKGGGPSAASEAVTRHAAAGRVDGERVLAALDSVINAFNDLLATKCGS